MLEAVGAAPGSPLECAEALTWRRVVWEEASPAGARPPLCLPVVFISCVCGLFREDGCEQGGKYDFSLALWLHVNSANVV